MLMTTEDLLGVGVNKIELKEGRYAGGSACLL